MLYSYRHYRAAEARKTRGIKFWSGETSSEVNLNPAPTFTVKGSFCLSWVRAGGCKSGLGTSRELLPEDRDTSKDFGSYAGN